MKKIQVYFLSRKEFLDSIDKDYLLSFLEDKSFKSEKKTEEYCLGRFLIKRVLEKFYDIKNPEIVIKNKKPCLKDERVHFSLSHSSDIVLCAFSSSPVGADVEFMLDRDFKKLSKRYSLPFEGNNKQAFYKFWTEYEAEIKLQSEPKSKVTIELEDNYILSLCSGVCDITADSVALTQLFYKYIK